MNKKLIILFAASVLMLVGCKKVTVDFTYSPAAPKAGEKVLFSNLSSAGETWNWTFGDNAISQSKNPSKVYKKPGEYLVTLMVDSAKNQTHTSTYIEPRLFIWLFIRGCTTSAICSVSDSSAYCCIRESTVV